MNLIGGDALLLIDSVEGHAENSAAPHCQSDPANSGGFRFLKRMQQRHEKHERDHAQPEIFEEMRGLENEAGSNFIPEGAEHCRTGIEVQSTHPCRFAVANAVEN